MVFKMLLTLSVMQVEVEGRKRNCGDCEVDEKCLRFINGSFEDCVEGQRGCACAKRDECPSEVSGCSHFRSSCQNYECKHGEAFLLKGGNIEPLCLEGPPRCISDPSKPEAFDVPSVPSTKEVEVEGQKGCELDADCASGHECIDYVTSQVCNPEKVRGPNDTFETICACSKKIECEPNCRELEYNCEDYECKFVAEGIPWLAYRKPSLSTKFGCVYSEKARCIEYKQGSIEDILFGTTKTTTTTTKTFKGQPVWG